MSGGDGIGRHASENRVVQRLLGKLQNRIMKVTELEVFLGDPNQGGCPEDRDVVRDWPAFTRRHRDTFCYDAEGWLPGPALLSKWYPPSVRTNQSWSQSETLVVNRLKARMRNAIMCRFSLQSFLSDPCQGGNRADFSIDDREGWAVFSNRHRDTFLYDNPYVSLRADPELEQQVPPSPTPTLNAEGKVQHKRLRLRSKPDGSTGNRWSGEKRVITRLQVKLQNRIMEVSGFGGFLGDPNQGGCPEDREVVRNWPDFVKRNTDKFCYDDSWEPALISWLGPPYKNPMVDRNDYPSEVEFRVVSRLVAKLRHRIESLADAKALCAAMQNGVRGIVFAAGFLHSLATTANYSPLCGIEEYDPRQPRTAPLRRTGIPPIGCIVCLRSDLPGECTVTFRVAEAIDRNIPRSDNSESVRRSRDRAGILILGP